MSLRARLLEVEASAQDSSRNSLLAKEGSDALNQVDSLVFEDVLPKYDTYELLGVRSVDCPVSPALLAMVVAAFFFSVNALIVKLLNDIPTYEIVFFRSAFMLMWTTVLLTVKRLNPLGPPGQRGFLVLRGAAGIGFMTGFYYAVRCLPLHDAVVINYTSPVLTAIGAALVLGEKWQAIDAFGSLLCFTGVILVSKPAFVFRFFGSTAEALPLDGVLGALVGACMSMVVYLVARILKGVHPLQFVHYFGMTGILAGPAFMFTSGAQWIWPDTKEWFLLVSLASLALAGEALMYIGLSLEAAAKATAINYLQVVFSIVFQVFLLHTANGLDSLSLLGAAMIAAWGAIALVKDSKRKQSAEPS